MYYYYYYYYYHYEYAVSVVFSLYARARAYFRRVFAGTVFESHSPLVVVKRATNVLRAHQSQGSRTTKREERRLSKSQKQRETPNSLHLLNPKRFLNRKIGTKNGVVVVGVSQRRALECRVLVVVFSEEEARVVDQQRRRVDEASVVVDIVVWSRAMSNVIFIASKRERFCHVVVSSRDAAAAKRRREKRTPTTILVAAT